MSDIETIVDFSKKLERIFRDKLGWKGKGLGKMLGKHRKKLPQSIVNNIFHFLKIRKETVHDEEQDSSYSSEEISNLIKAIDEQLNFFLSPPFCIQEVLTGFPEEVRAEIVEEIFLFSRLDIPSRCQKVKEIRESTNHFPLLVYALQDKNSEVRQCALEILGRWKDLKKSVPVILEMMVYETNPDVRCLLGYTLHSISLQSETLRIIHKTWTCRDKRYLDWEDDELVKFLNAICKDMNTHYLSCILSRSLQNENPHIRLWAAQLLWKIESTKEILPFLISSLQTQEEKILLMTFDALGSIGQVAKPSVSALLPFLANKNQEIRYKTFSTLSDIEPTKREMFYALYDLHTPIDGNIRSAACKLSQMKQYASEIVPFLVESILNPILPDDIWVLKQLTQALKTLGAEMIQKQTPKIPQEYTLDEPIRLALESARLMKDIEKVIALWYVSQGMDKIEKKQEATQVLEEAWKAIPFISESQNRRQAIRSMLPSLSEQTGLWEKMFPEILVQIFQISDEYQKAECFLMIGKKLARLWLEQGKFFQDCQKLILKFSEENRVKFSEEDRSCLIASILYYGVELSCEMKKLDDSLFNEFLSLSRMDHSWKVHIWRPIADLLIKNDYLEYAGEAAFHFILPGYQSDIYDQIADCYQQRGDEEKAKIFKEKSQKMNDDDNDDDEISMSPMLVHVFWHLHQHQKNYDYNISVSKSGILWFCQMPGFNTSEIAMDLLTFRCFSPEFFNKALQLIEKERKEAQPFAWIDWAIWLYNYRQKHCY